MVRTYNVKQSNKKDGVKYTNVLKHRNETTILPDVTY